MKEEKTVFYPYSSWLKQRYGEKVYKLPVNLPVSCPNRCDGHGGCTFCSNLGGGENGINCSWIYEVSSDMIKNILELDKGDFTQPFEYTTNQ